MADKSWMHSSDLQLKQENVKPILHCQQPELFEHGVRLFHNNSTPHRHQDVQNVVQCCDWEMLAHSPYSLDLAPCD